jgi:coenzyme F420-reducing hydrogenase delta subunit
MATAALDAPGRDGPLILGLCCQRSGIAALDAAGKSGASMSPRFHPIRIPCAGIVSSNVLLRLLNLGVDHIMVVACHDDNCKNRHGSHLASQRVLAIQQTLQVLGEDTSRVTFHAISSNSPRILIERVRKLADR